MSIGKGFGQRLGLLRRERGLVLGRDVPQSEVARDLGIPPTTYSRLEAGVFKRSPELATLKSLAKYFSVTLGWLWFGEGERRAGNGEVQAPARSATSSTPAAAKAGGRKPR